MKPLAPSRANQPKPNTQVGRQTFVAPFHEVHETASESRNQAFADTICSIPRGKVATYGQVAAAAGYPRYHRAVARLLSKMIPGAYPWQRVVGAQGEIKVTGPGAAAEQRLRLKMEGVTFKRKRVNLNLHQHIFEPEQ